MPRTSQHLWIRVFAPATIGNVGPGFDVFGAAIDGLGDEVAARRCERGVTLLEVGGESGLSPSPQNTACVAAREVLSALGVDWGVELKLHKGLPVGSGLGSSGASAAAAATAVNRLAEHPLPTEQLVTACALAEQSACGAAHRDNVAPALLGGFVLIRPEGGISKVSTGLPLAVALIKPRIAIATRRAREAIPEQIPLTEAVHNSGHLASLVLGLSTDNLALIGEALSDRIAEPRRAALIPGFLELKQTALLTGALGASISGAGPTLFALCADLSRARSVMKSMSARCQKLQIEHDSWALPIDRQGARELPGTL